MNYIQFRELFIGGVAFTTRQVMMVLPEFNMANIYRWCKKGYIIKLRNGYYAFRECLSSGRYNYFLSQFIYRPSYISLQTALSLYGLIPEGIFSTTAVSTLKTMTFSNEASSFAYQTISPKLFWGYERFMMNNGKQAYNLASIEKALLDFLYLNPYYNTEEDFVELRFDDYIMNDVVDREILFSYSERFGISSLDDRLRILLQVYC